MLPRKIFENLHTAMAILVRFEQFQAKFVVILSASPTMKLFVRTYSIMRA